MKYYHIIYNSSERSLDGGVGFGIRTATEGTPVTLLNAIRNISFFTDDWESYDKKPTPAQLKEDPSSIESVAMNYAVTTIKDETNKSYYVIARRVYVGFDYGFYKSGATTRPGNYVIDYYVFENEPDKSVYELLYENPQIGSNHFIPSSARPTTDNEEMREISLGNPVPLPVEDKPFKGNCTDALDKDVVKLFFCYLKSKKEKKRLVVKADRTKSLRLTADIYRMLSQTDAVRLRTYINLRSQGVNDSFDIFFVHDDYQYPLSSNQLYNYVDINNCEMPDMEESRLYSPRLESIVTSSFVSNYDDVSDILKWILMPEFDVVKKMTKETSDAFFVYCVQPTRMEYAYLVHDDGTINEELMKVFSDLFARDKEKSTCFNSLLVENLMSADSSNLCSLVCNYCDIKKCGIEMKSVEEKVREHVSEVLISDFACFARILEKHGVEKVSQLFQRSAFVQCSKMVAAKELYPYMPKLYRWLFSDEDLNKKKMNCVFQFMRNDLENKLLYEILDDIYGGDNSKIISGLCNILKGNHKPFAYVWPMLEHYFAVKPSDKDFVLTFEDRKDNVEYAPLFYYQYKTNKCFLDSLDKIKDFTSLMRGNAELKRMVVSNYQKDKLYAHVCDLIGKMCDSQPEEAAKFIRDNITDFLAVNDAKLTILLLYINAVLGNVSKLEKSQFKDMYTVVCEHKNVKIFNSMLGLSIKHAREEILNYKELATAYRDLNPNAKCKDAIEKMGGDWHRMTGYLLRDVYKVNFKEAMEILNSIEMKEKFRDEVLTEYYKKDYSSYKRKTKIKNFFKSICSLFKPKKKKKEDKCTKK